MAPLEVVLVAGQAATQQSSRLGTQHTYTQLLTGASCPALEYPQLYITVSDLVEWLERFAVWPGTGLFPDTELVELAVSLASTELCSGAPSCAWDRSVYVAI